MPLSLRARRLAVYDYSDTGTDGRRAQTFAKNASGDADGNWWGSIVVPSGREVEVAANKGYQVDAVIGLSAEVTVDPQGVIKDPASGATYKITAVLPRDAGRAEQQIMAQRVDDAQYTFDEFVATWRTHPRIVLLSEAEGQDTTQQIVRSTIGPDGWLGDSPANTTNDPTYASDPARWVFTSTAGVRITFGDVLLSLFNEPAGFTLAVAIQFARINGAFVEIPLTGKYTPGNNGVRMYLSSGTFGALTATTLSLVVKHGGDTGFTNYDIIDVTLSTGAELANGGYVFSAHYDRTQARGSRGGLWKNGAALAGATDFAFGAESAIATTASAAFGGGAYGGMAVAWARGVMPASWHENLYQDAVNRGWV